MLKTSFLLAIVLAIQYVYCEEGVPAPVEAAVPVAPVVPAVVEPLSLTAPVTADLAAGATPSLLNSLDVSFDGHHKLHKKKKVYYPVDLIGKKKACISIEHIHKCGNVHKWFEPNNKMTIQACLRRCLGHKSSYAALSNGNQCLCSNSTITKDAPKGTSDLPCTGNLFQKCGSQTCADLYVLKINSDTLRHSIRNLEEKNTWAHKNGWTSWSRFVDEKFDFSLVELFPSSNAIYAYHDCAYQPRSTCQTFNVVLNGYEDAIIASKEVTPIDVEWDIVFAKEKSSHAGDDVLLFRRSLCQWLLKENEVVVNELAFVSFDEKARTITLVDTKDSTRTFKVNDFFVKEFVSGEEKSSFTGKWFNKIHHFKDYFRGADACAVTL